MDVGELQPAWLTKQLIRSGEMSSSIMVTKLAQTMEKYPPNGVVGAMQFGLLAPHWTVDDLGIADQTSFSSPSQGRADAPAIRYRVAISAKS